MGRTVLLRLKIKKWKGILYDSISKLDFNINNSSILTGAVVQDESNAGFGDNGYANNTLQIERNDDFFYTDFWNIRKELGLL